MVTQSIQEVPMFKGNIFLALFCAFVSGCATGPAEGGSMNEKEISRLSVNGSVKPVFDKLSSNSFPDLQRKYQSRFVDERANIIESGSILGQVHSAFKVYWTRVLLEELNSDDGFRFLYSELEKIASRLGKSFGAYSNESAKSLAKFLQSKLQEKEGIYSLWGVTRPHAEFMAWASQNSKVYDIDLGDVKTKVSVDLLGDFKSYGWLGYATFDEIHTGGWATKEKLFCVSTKYDLESEAYKISYLSHEGRHFSDYSRFPQLEGGDLEYRAKLTELIFAEKSFDELLSNFSVEGVEDKSSSHAYASFVLVKNLKEETGSDELQSLDRTVLKKAAKKLLEKHTQMLMKAGSSKVKSVI
jgi:hypothetical protein